MKKRRVRTVAAVGVISAGGIMFVLAAYFQHELIPFWRDMLASGGIELMGGGGLVLVMDVLAESIAERAADAVIHRLQAKGSLSMSGTVATKVHRREASETNEA